MKKSFLLLFLTILLAIVMVACGSDDTPSDSVEDVDTEETTQGETDDQEQEPTEGESSEVTIDHELGQTVVEKNPETVVVFDLGVLDSLDTLGVEVAGVPVESVPDYLSQYESAENVGTLFEPDFEKIFDMQPDLIIISGRAQEAYEELSEIAPTLFMSTDPTRYLESFKENVTLLGDIFGKEDLAAEKITEIETSVAALQEKTTTNDVSGLIVLANDGSLSAFGPESRFGFLHGDFGVEPADENIEESSHGQSISFEYIVETDPEYLFVVDRGAIVGGESSAQQTVENEVTESTTAYQEGKIVYLDPVYWYITTGGISATEGMIAEVEAAIE